MGDAPATGFGANLNVRRNSSNRSALRRRAPTLASVNASNLDLASTAESTTGGHARRRRRRAATTVVGTMASPHQHRHDTIHSQESSVAPSMAASSGVEETDSESDDPRHSVHALSAAYESLNYETIVNKVYQEEDKSEEHSRTLWRRTLNRWIVCFLIGVTTALIASFIDIMVNFSAKLKFEIIMGYIFNYCADENCLVLGVLAWIGLNVAFVSVAAALVVFYAGPVAAGSGIPQIKCFLNGIMIPGVVRLKTLIAKALGVAFSVAGGLSVGKEGPMIHSGAIVAAGISQGRAVSLPIDLHIYEYFRNDREKRDFVSAGAAAGVAAAFGAPIGGVLFSLEEGASFWNQALTWRMFFSSMISSVVLSAVLSWFHGHPGLLSWNGLANFGSFANLEFNWWELGIYIVIGCLGGLSGALFNYLNTRMTVFRQHFLQKKWQRFVEALLVAATSSVMAFSLIYWSDDCNPLRVANETTPLQMWCPNGQYSATAQLFFRSPEESVKMLFHAPIGTFQPATLIAFAIVYWFLTCWTYGVSVPSGLFIPTLLTGAAWGRLIGLAVHHMFPDADIELSPGKFALAGAAAQLGGVVRMTISLCTIIMEATREIQFGLPIMLVLLAAKWTGDLFNEGLYDIHIHLNEVPLLGWEPPKLSANILAKQVMKPLVTTLAAIESVGRIFGKLVHTRHHGFPIVDDSGQLQGLILRHQLLTLLHKRAFHTTSTADGDMVIGAQPVTLADFNYKHLRLAHMAHVTDDDKHNCYLDLRPYMNPAPHRVPLEASLSLMFQVFRGLGLRHIIVVDKHNILQGIVTRKDIARYREIQSGITNYKIEEIYISEQQ